MFRRYSSPRLSPHEYAPVNVVGDGAIQTLGVANGAFIPVCILDSRERPDIEELVRLHREGPLGDVRSTWMRVKGVSEVCLYLEFLSPVASNVIVTFEVERQYLLIDTIVRTRCFYLQTGEPGDVVSQTIDRAKILVEVTADGFSGPWNKILKRVLSQKLKSMRLNRKSKSKLVEEQIQLMRGIMDRRLRK